MKKKYTAFDWFVSAFIFVVPAVVSVIIALSVPSDILKNEWARYWVEFVLQVFPKLLDVPAESLDPEVVKFYHAAMLSFVTIWIIPSVSILTIKMGNDRRSDGRFRTKWEMAKSLGGSFVFLIAFWVAFSWGYHDGRGTGLWHSRFSLMFTATLFHLGLLLGVTSFFAQLIEIVVFLKFFNRAVSLKKYFK